MARAGVHWLAGPVGYKLIEGGMYPDRIITYAKWDFVGATSGGEFRRWCLTFNIETRKFTSAPLTVSDWDKAHTKELADLYRSCAILRHMLPKGGIAVAMRAMVSERDIAAVTGIAITKGRL